MSVYVPVNLRQQLRRQFSNCCAYCRTAEHLTVVTFEVEHIIPIASGGETALANLCLACPTCNRHKALRVTAVDPQTDRVVSLFHPQQQKWSDHFAWSADQTELIGLTAIGRATIDALRINRPQLVRTRRMWGKMGEHPPL
jgi:hypothetical protein